MSKIDQRPTDTRVVILAGGFGTRIKHLLQDIPKPMAPVAGRPFVEWVIRWFSHHGFSDFYLSTGYLAEVIDRHFQTQPVPGAKVSCVPETDPLGTAGGFLNCVSHIPEAKQSSWIVANGDSLVFTDPRPLVALLEGGADAALLGLEMEDASRYGTLGISSGSALSAFQEKRPGFGIINAGVYAFSSNTVKAMPPQRPASFELDIFPTIAAGGRAKVHTVKAPFLDIGTPASLAQAEEFISSHLSLFNPSSTP